MVKDTSDEIPDIERMELDRAEQNKREADSEAKMKQEIDQFSSPDKAMDIAMSFGPFGAAGATKKVITEAVNSKVAKVAAEEAAVALEGMGKAAYQTFREKLPQGLADALPLSARDLLHLMVLPQNPSPERLELFGRLMAGAEEDLVRATAVQLKGVPYAWATFGGAAGYAASKVADYVSVENKATPEQALAKQFVEASHLLTPQKRETAMLQLMTTQSSEINHAVSMYLGVQKGLMQDKSLSEQDLGTLQHVTGALAEKLAKGEPIVESQVQDSGLGQN